MLQELHISNLAVIEDATIRLRPGLNCFTGQTGAGKSLVLGAFEILLGLRRPGDLLRPGAEEGRVSGLFEVSDPATVRRLEELAELDLGQEAPAQLLVTRRLFASGRTSVSLNGRPAAASMLRPIGRLLVDIHGQHDHQFLLRPANQLLMLDRFADCEAVREQFVRLRRELLDLEAQRAELEASRALRRQQLELHEFQAREIDEAAPREGEYEQVETRHRLLSQLDRVRREAGEVMAVLQESEPALLDQLHAARSVLQRLGELDERLAPMGRSVEEAVTLLQEVGFDLSRYLHDLELNPAELEELTGRLNLLHRLIHKYGRGEARAGAGTLDEVLAHRRRLDTEMQRLRAQDGDLGEMSNRAERLRAQLRKVGQQLTAARRRAAERLAPRVETELAELGLAGARFKVALEPVGGEPEEAASGLETVQLQVQTNPGQPARPLRRIASGGELSRIMLAIKSIGADADRISVLVFDEVDANVGGRMGTVIGRKLRRLAAAHQVLCITHLPQIAAFADHHVKITKQVHEGVTRTGVHALEAHQRIEELAEMLGGRHASPTSRKQAQEMLDLAAGDASPKGGSKALRARSPAGRSNRKK